MKNKLTAFAVLLLSLFVVVSVAQASTNVKITWADSKDSAHPAISGVAMDLRAQVYGTDTGLTYTWNFGDTKTASGSVPANKAIATSHTFTGALKKKFTVTLTVKKANGTTLGTDTTYVIISPNDRTTKKALAVEKGLWFLHTTMIRDTTIPAHGSQPRGWMGPRYDDWTTPLTTLVGAMGYVEAGFKAKVNTTSGAFITTDENPYVDDLNRMVVYATERLVVIPITKKGGGSSGLLELDPENSTTTITGTKDGYAVHFRRTSENEYEYAAALRFLANAGLSTTKVKAYNNDLNLTGNTAKNINNMTYAQVVQQMIDFFAWTQLYDAAMDYDEIYDETGKLLSTVRQNSSRQVWPSKRGSWTYWIDGWSWVRNGQKDEWGNDIWEDIRGAYGDSAMAYWIVTGLKPAQQMGAAWPTFVKTELDSFLLNAQDLTGNATTNPYFGEFRFGEGLGHHMVERAGQGLVLLNWVGVNNSDNRVSAAQNYIKKYWSKYNYNHWQGWATSTRGDNQCFDIAGNPEDCYSHWKLNSIEVGYYIPTGYSDYCCDAIGDCVDMSGCWGNCTEEYVSYGWCTTEQIGQCMPGWEYCVQYECVAPYQYYTCPTNNEWLVEGNHDDLNVFAFLNITEGLQATGQSASSSFASDVDPNGLSYANRYIDLLVKNQFARGSWHDNGWVSGDPFGTAWALMVLSKL